MKIALVFGTRPEAIKMAPVIWEFEKRGINHKIIVTAQHREMLDQVLETFNIKPHYDLRIMQHEQTLSEISINIFEKINNIYQKEKPDLLLVQGDTLTSFIVSLAAFYEKIPIGHIEAGLRTHKKYYPYPEEMDRQLIDVLADYYFVPTQLAKKNLLKEGKDINKIFVTGNTVVDSLLQISQINHSFTNKNLEKVDFSKYRVILLEMHRRETWGRPMEIIYRSLRNLVDKNEKIFLIVPVHKNPIIQKSAHRNLSNHPRILLTEPLDYLDLVQVLKNVYLVITDSGGLQEEAPTFGKPVLVVRDYTERMEGIKAGLAKLTGLNPQVLVKETEKLIKNETLYRRMSKKENPYGDGHAAKRIVDIILKKLEI